MASITDIIVATTQEECEAAAEALRQRNGEDQSDAAVVAQFLAGHVALDGAPLLTSNA